MKHLSYSKMRLWKRDRDEFYRRYMATPREPRTPQGRAAAVGSAFDVIVKRYLADDLGLSVEDMTEQVEPQHRDWAMTEGLKIAAHYVECGAYDELRAVLQAASNIRFEEKITGEIDGVPFVGAPDLSFTTDRGVPVALDWKVKGYCSARGTSPTKGYVTIRPGNKRHRLCFPIEDRGLDVATDPFESFAPEYAAQLTLYGCLLGFVRPLLWIDEISALSGQRLRTATYRGFVTPEFQRSLLADVAACWEAIRSGRLWPELSPDENARRADLFNRSLAAGQVFTPSKFY